MLLKLVGQSVTVAIAVAVLAQVSECVAQVYTWEGNQNGDGPFICDPPAGEPFSYFYPVSNSWVTSEVWADDCLLAPSNWSQPDFPNSPSAQVLIPAAGPGMSYPPTLGATVSVDIVEVELGAQLDLVGGRLTVSTALRNGGRLELLNGYVDGRISNLPSGTIHADNSTLRGPLENNGTIELVPSRPLGFDDAEYSGTGVIEGDPAGAGVAGKVTVVGGEMTFRNGRIFVGSGLAPIILINNASVGFDDVEASMRTMVTNNGTFRVGDGAVVSNGADFDNTNGVIAVDEGGDFIQAVEVLRGGTIIGRIKALGGTLTGTFSLENGELAYPHGAFSFVDNAIFNGGEITGDEMGSGISGGTMTTEGVTFGHGIFQLGSSGSGPIFWTIVGTNYVADIDLKLDRGQATNNGRLVIEADGIFRTTSFDNTNGVIEVKEGGEFVHLGGDHRGGAIIGRVKVMGGSLTGTFSLDDGELAYPQGSFSTVDNAIIRSGEITGDEMGSGIAGGSMATDGVMFRRGIFQLGSGGSGPVAWTIIGTNYVEDIDLKLDRGQATNNGRLVVADGAIFRTTSFDNTNGVIEVQAGGEFIHLGGDHRGGAIIGRVKVMGGSLTGSFSLGNGELTYPHGSNSSVNNAIFHGGEITGDQMGSGISSGSMTTDGVTFRHGIFQLGSGGSGPVAWTIIGTNYVEDINLIFDRGQATNNGRLVIAEGGIFRTTSFDNTHGVIEVQAGGVVFSQNLINNGEGTIHVDGTFHTNGVFDVQNGELRGSGVIVGTVVNSGGTVAPGSSPGSLIVDGNYTQQQAALLSLEIGGSLPGMDYDQFKVTGNATIAGGIEIEFIDGFLPRVGDRFDLIQADGSLNLASDIEINVLGVPNAFRYTTNINDGMFSMEVLNVPEPASFTLSMMTAVIAMRWIRSARSTRRRPRSQGAFS
jgi:hypothetical protein